MLNRTEAASAPLAEKRGRRRVAHTGVVGVAMGLVMSNISCSSGLLAPEGVRGAGVELTVASVDDEYAPESVYIWFEEDALVTSDRPKVFRVAGDDLYVVGDGRLEVGRSEDFEVGSLIRMWPVEGDRSSEARAHAVVLLRRGPAS